MTTQTQLDMTVDVAGNIKIEIADERSRSWILVKPSSFEGLIETLLKACRISEYATHLDRPKPAMQASAKHQETIDAPVDEVVEEAVDTTVETTVETIENGCEVCGSGELTGEGSLAACRSCGHQPGSKWSCSKCGRAKISGNGHRELVDYNICNGRAYETGNGASP